MMIYDVAMVEDKGSYWDIQGVTQNSFDTVDKEQKYLKLSAVSAKLIQDAIMAGHEVRVTKPLRAGEVLPNEVNIVKVKEDDVDAFRNSQIKRVRMLINPELASLSGLTLYGFICLNNELADKGYFITDSNRESKYLSILETGDEKLIALLEDYLNYKDEVARVASLHKIFEKFRKEIKDEDDKEKMQKLADDFMSVFYSRF
jgi:hypothetical protein